MSPRLLTVEDVLSAEMPPPGLRISYGEDPLQFGELRLPAGEARHPVAIVIHGGCWRSRYDAGHIAGFSDALTRGGIATWTIEYRRVGDPGGGWPGTLLDVGLALDRLRELALRHPLDPRRVAAVGHSAGGQLALWLAARSRLSGGSALRGGAGPLRLRGVVALAAVTDLARAVREGVCDDMAARLLGGSPAEVPSRYAEASPIELLPLEAPQHLLQGILDPVVPPDFARDFAERSRSSGSACALTLLEEAGHFEPIAPASHAFRLVANAVRSMLEP